MEENTEWPRGAKHVGRVYRQAFSITHAIMLVLSKQVEMMHVCSVCKQVYATSQHVNQHIKFMQSSMQQAMDNILPTGLEIFL